MGFTSCWFSRSQTRLAGLSGLKCQVYEASFPAESFWQYRALNPEIQCFWASSPLGDLVTVFRKCVIVTA